MAYRWLICKRNLCMYIRLLPRYTTMRNDNSLRNVWFRHSRAVKYDKMIVWIYNMMFVLVIWHARILFVRQNECQRVGSIKKILYHFLESLCIYLSRYYLRKWKLRFSKWDMHKESFHDNEWRQRGRLRIRGKKHTMHLEVHLI